MNTNAFFMTRQLAFAILFASLLPHAVQAAEQAQPVWEHEITLYGWATDLDGKASGSKAIVDFSYDVSDILDNLNFAFMGTLESRYGKWSIIADLLYMDVEDDEQRAGSLGPRGGDSFSADVEVEMTSWVVQGGIGYELLNTQSGRLTAIGGLRYLNVDIDSDLHYRGEIADIRVSDSDSKGIIDGIVGFQGACNFNDRWYLPYYADIGAGDSEVTWQLFAGIGYRFSWGHVRVGYRMLSWEFDDDDMVLEDLELYGPIAGVTFVF